MTRRLKLGLAVMLLTALTGCYVDGGYGGAVVVPAPAPDPFWVWGGPHFWHGGYEHGHEVHEFSHRGFISRGHRR